jgi:hypothetical protein
MAALLDEAGKPVVVWAEQDVPDVLERLEEERRCGAILLHDSRKGFRNLEEALAQGASITALARGLAVLANDRGYSWPDQRADLVSRCGNVGIDAERRERMKAADSLRELLVNLEESTARALIADALAAKNNLAPFYMKGGRQARILAEELVAAEGVPRPFAEAFRSLSAWVVAGCARGARIVMGGPCNAA